MEIVHVTRQFLPNIGGLEDAVYNLCRHLARLPDMKVRVVTLDRAFSNLAKQLPPHELVESIDVHRIGFVGSRRYPIAPRVLQAIGAADIIHVHAIDFFFDYLALMAPLHKKPLVASTHGGFFHTRFGGPLKKVFFNTVTRASAQAYDAICASSDSDAMTFSRIARSRVVTIENGVAVEKWLNRGSPTPRKTMIFIGRWSANKRIGVLFDLLAALRGHAGDWRLIIVGTPFDDNLDALSKMAQQADVAECVKFAVGPNEAAIGDLLSEASYIVSASVYEGFGISIIEGLSAGLYPILSSIPPFDKLRSHLGFGERIAEDDLAMTATNIERAHQNLTETTAEYRGKAMEFAKQYNWRSVAEKIHAVYQEVYESHNGALGAIE